MILYLDCFAGISGDMMVAALLDLGVPISYICGELEKLGIPHDSYELSTSRANRHSIAALKFDVKVNDQHTHRKYAEIDAMIAGSLLTNATRDRSRLIFRRLAEAEATVHGVAIEDVYFHEVGAIDSIVDIVATAAALDFLNVKEICVSALPLGSGFVNTAHGQLPVPAPATTLLLKGLSVHTECGPGERVTPTGAAIVSALATATLKRPAMILEKTGTGAGGKDFPDCPNILRAFLGKPLDNAERFDVVMVVESNIDDSTPEVLGYTMGRLFEEGALDVWFTPIQMKKNRPGVMLSLLCKLDTLDRLVKIVLTETSAIGLRHYRADRTIFERRIIEQQTEFGTVHFKQVLDSNGELLRTRPEFEDCRRIASEKHISCSSVIQKLQAAGASQS